MDPLTGIVELVRVFWRSMRKNSKNYKVNNKPVLGVMESSFQLLRCSSCFYRVVFSREIFLRLTRVCWICVIFRQVYFFLNGSLSSHNYEYSSVNYPVSTIETAVILGRGNNIFRFWRPNLIRWQSHFWFLSD